MTENTKELLRRISALGASDLFIVAGRPLSYRLNNQIIQDDSERLLPGDTREIIEDIYRLAEDRNIKTFEETGDDDFSFALPGISRFRVSAYKQRGSLAAVIRMITFTLPSPREMGIPDNIIGLSALNKGLVLVTGRQEAESQPRSPVSSTISTTPRKNISLPWKIRWNICTAMTRASSASGRSTQIRKAMSQPCAPLCARARM